MVLSVPVFAADEDPLAIVNNLSDFIFSCIKAIGVMVLGWGIVQLGMSVQSHTPASALRESSVCSAGLSSLLQRRFCPPIGVA